MKAIGITSAAIVFFLSGVTAPTHSQQGQPGPSRDYPGQHDNGHGNSHQKQSKSQRAQEQQRVRHDVWQEHRAKSWESDHRSWQQRGGYEGYVVPDSRYRRYFGPQHAFRIDRLPFRVAQGYPRFQYRGYWLSPVDPWPENWANNWYATDDVYVNHVDNGYYLFNRRHPEARIALRISI